ncbi:MAG: ribosomal RNA small subunit methyltransferase A [Desulfuromonadales bacterium GWC2_61_20]|nr:MAG: ribosomal RNA small subunit methyltransferase A [Desulfuromonadales bacterium GWC2_61_20]HAD04273.1 ribosomal RNA small subunit methyltransferase A [Desulfuromonas sp.]HBT83366.1 ribosomal RNA small subunit methyltransferase A [Desulfuromonas sp.]
MDYKAKKQYGQNFLRDRHVLGKIIEAAALSTDDKVLEIGPGLGALTDLMLPRAGLVRVMEVDSELVERLQGRSAANLVIHQGDALRLPWKELLLEPPYKLVANLPYNISSQVLFKILEHRPLFSRLVLMFQKEVGDRLCAPPGGKDYGILSVHCQLWFEIRRVTIVPPGAFVPVPKVDSVVLAFTPLATPRAVVADEPFFRRVVKGAFGQRRKTLRNALLGAGFVESELRAALDVAGIDGGRRAETLNIQEFAALSTALAGSDKGER